MKSDENPKKYQVKFKRTAEKQLSKLPRQIQKKLRSYIDEKLTKDPRPAGVRKLVGKDNLYRIRVGNYRIIYQINDDTLVVRITKLGDRRDVYKDPS